MALHGPLLDWPFEKAEVVLEALSCALLKDQTQLNAVNDDGNTAICEALALADHVPSIITAVEWFISKGADLDVRNKRGLVALHHAALMEKAQAATLCGLLLAAGANPTLAYDVSDDVHQTPADVARGQQNAALCETLIAAESAWGGSGGDSGGGADEKEEEEAPPAVPLSASEKHLAVVADLKQRAFHGDAEATNQLLAMTLEERGFDGSQGAGGGMALKLALATKAEEMVALGN